MGSEPAYRRPYSSLHSPSLCYSSFQISKQGVKKNEKEFHHIGDLFLSKVLTALKSILNLKKKFIYSYTHTHTQTRNLISPLILPNCALCKKILG